MKKDFFISFANEDAAWAREAAKDLESKGYTVWYQTKDISYGDNFVSTIGDSFIEDTRHFIIIWSRHYNKSKWCKQEENMIVHKVVSSKGKSCLVPIRVDTYPVKGHIRPYVNLSYLDSNRHSSILTRRQRKKALLEAVKGITPIREIIDDYIVKAICYGVLMLLAIYFITNYVFS